MTKPNPKAPTPQTITELLAARGLVPRPVTLEAYDAATIAELHRTYDCYERAAAEIRHSVAYVTGLASACADILRCQGDEPMVKRLRALIETEDLGVAETIKWADTILTYILAERPPLSA